MVFCLPLVIGLAAIYISERSDSELAYLTTAVAAVSFLVSLVLLPWQLKLLLLAGVYWLARKQLTAISASPGHVSEFTSTESSAEPLSAESLMMAESEQEIVGKYRGATWKATPVVEPTAAQVPLADLKYRGAHFSSTSPHL